MKILVVFTGGTIGSSQADGIILTDSGKPHRILEMYKEKYPTESDILWEVAFPYEELSENMTCSLLGSLITYLRDNCIDRDYDGIIITHGTDTLQYTAAALSYCFGDLTIPAVLVSSNYILEDSRANGFINFVNAVEFIKSGGNGGVFVSYQNFGECAKIHAGTRLISHKAYSDVIESIYDVEYGYFDNEGFKINTQYIIKDEDTDICRIFRSSIDNKDIVHYGFSDILWIRPYVGMNYPNIAQNVKAILHDTYHSGTICSKASDLAEFAEAAKKKEIPVFVCGSGDSAIYGSKRIYGELGFKVLPVASPVAMYIKLWLCLRSGLDLMEMMPKNVCGDTFIDYSGC